MLAIIYLGESIVALGTTPLGKQAQALQARALLRPLGGTHAFGVTSVLVRGSSQTHGCNVSTLCCSHQVLGTVLGGVIVWAIFLSIYHLEAGQKQHALRQVRAKHMVALQS